MNNIPHLELSDFPDWGKRLRRDYQSAYFAMYSSVYGGIVTDPVLMMIPADDHLAHRGDGVFETMKCVDGAIYNLDAHLDRLDFSARHVAIEWPFPREELSRLILATTRAGGQRECTIRVLVSRGPGSLGINPYDCPKSELYILVYTPGEPFMDQFPDGARARASTVPVKPGFLANIKSCNYLPNVLMKKEAVDAGVDFVLSFDENGFLAEGPAESAAIVNTDNCLQIPTEDRILPGTTLRRAATLAESLVSEGTLRAVEHTHIPRGTLATAREVLILGTTPDIAAVVEFDGQPIGTGQPGLVGRRLGELLQQDIEYGTSTRVPVF